MRGATSQWNFSRKGSIRKLVLMLPEVENVEKKSAKNSSNSQATKSKKQSDICSTFPFVERASDYAAMGCLSSKVRFLLAASPLSRGIFSAALLE
jgi:hypothetical protein